MEHVFGRLFEIIFLSDLAERNFFWEEIDSSENITDTHRVGEIAFVATTVFERRSNAPTDFTVLTEGSSRIGRNVSNNFGTERSKRAPIKIVIATKRGMSRHGRVDSRGAKQV